MTQKHMHCPYQIIEIPAVATGGRLCFMDKIWIYFLFSTYKTRISDAAKTKARGRQQTEPRGLANARCRAAQNVIIVFSH